MPIELNTSNTKIAYGADLQESAEAQAGGVKKSAIIGGASVNVVSAPADLDKLVATLKSENEETRQNVAQRRIAILMTVISSMAERVSDSQRANFVKIELLNSEIADEEESIKGYQDDLSTAKGRSAELQTRIKALEKAIEDAVEDGKEHRETVEALKREKAEEDAKIRDLTNAIASAEAKISGYKSQIQSCADAIGAATMSEVAAAVKAAAGEQAEPEQAESNAEIEKKEKKAEAADIAASIQKALDKLDRDITKTIEENRSEMV